MKFISTRDINKNKYNASEIILKGIADDGGLFVPEEFPTIDYGSMINDNYIEIAKKIFKEYLTEFSETELDIILHKAYDEENYKGEVAPLVKLDENIFSLELWHGKTLAFKDVALQVLPYLLTASIEKNIKNKEILILTATSGDTGKAALEGFAGVNKINIAVFYPHKAISEIQELQMVTQERREYTCICSNGKFR